MDENHGDVKDKKKKDKQKKDKKGKPRKWKNLQQISPVESVRVACETVGIQFILPAQFSFVRERNV